jgi:hypothetical protein
MVDGYLNGKDLVECSVQVEDNDFSWRDLRSKSKRQSLKRQRGLAFPKNCRSPSTT